MQMNVTNKYGARNSLTPVFSSKLKDWPKKSFKGMFVDHKNEHLETQNIDL